MMFRYLKTPIVNIKNEIVTPQAKALIGIPAWFNIATAINRVANPTPGASSQERKIPILRENKARTALPKKVQ